MKPSRSAGRGFTITEVMVALAVLVILSGVAIPSFHDIFLAQAVKSASFEVWSDLVLARSEAVTRNTTVSLVPTGGSWSAGWTLIDFSGEVVRRQDRLPRVVITGPSRVTYNGAGRASTGGASFNLVANGGRNPHPSCISIDLSGRPVQRQEPCL
ncbi:MAG: GspH/FimT family pseudopilin [Burkholderiales bacterium]